MKTCMVVNINFVGVHVPVSSCCCCFWWHFFFWKFPWKSLKFSACDRVKFGLIAVKLSAPRHSTQIRYSNTLHCMHWKFAIFELDLDLHLLWSKNRQLHLSTIRGCVFLCHSVRCHFHLIDSSSYMRAHLFTQRSNEWTRTLFRLCTNAICYRFTTGIVNCLLLLAFFSIVVIVALNVENFRYGKFVSVLVKSTISFALKSMRR